MIRNFKNFKKIMAKNGINTDVFEAMEVEIWIHAVVDDVAKVVAAAAVAEETETTIVTGAFFYFSILFVY